VITMAKNEKTKEELEGCLINAERKLGDLEEENGELRDELHSMINLLEVASDKFRELAEDLDDEAQDMHKKLKKKVN